MKPQTAMRVARVKEELQQGKTRLDFEQALSKEFEIAPTTMGYYITLAHKEFEKEEQEKKEVIARIRREQIEDEAKELIMKELEADAYLSQIIRGERKEEKIVVTKRGGVQVVKIAPRIADVLNAFRSYYVRESNKRFRSS